MPTKREPSTATDRKLFLDAAGRCMNPACEKELYDGDSFIGNRAHIEPHSAGGPPSLDNLVLLCQECHTLTEPTKTPEQKAILREWKRTRTEQTHRRLSRTFPTFGALAEVVVPILNENYAIWNTYGPNGDSRSAPERFAHWQRSTPRLLMNNRKLAMILAVNKRLLHKQNQEVVDQFILHVAEFEETREAPESLRQALFPQDLNSIFGIEPSLKNDTIHNVGALERYIAHLIDQDRFIALDLTPNPVLHYCEHNGALVAMDLRDVHRVWQELYNAYSYVKPADRGPLAPLKEILYAVRRLDQLRVPWVHQDPTKLAEITVRHKHTVLFVYTYVVSTLDLSQLEPMSDSIVVNLHNFGPSTSTGQAQLDALDIGVTIMSQREFFQWVRSVK